MTSKKTGNARLLKLAKFLRSLPPKRFDYTVWVGEDWKGAPDLSCGTKACALGWATTLPSLRRLGLRMVRDEWGDHGIFLRDRYGAFDAAEDIFVLNDDESCFLFSPEEGEGDATPKQVAKKIEKFVAARA